MAIGEGGDRAIEIGTGDATQSMMRADQTPLAVDGVAVGVSGRVAEDRRFAVGFIPFHDAVVGDVTPDHVTSCREVSGAFRPAASFRELFDASAALDAGIEPLVMV